ncbi:MAG: tetratricopeptide repeat protein, partial [bacterium]
MTLKPKGFDLLGVSLLALALRLIYVVQLSDTPFFAAPIVDAAYHDAWAREILRLGIGHEGVFFRAPLYPYFVALVYLLTDGSFFAARIAQALLGMTTAALCYLLAWQVSKRRSVALFAGYGAAIYGMLVYFDGELLLETLFIPLLLAACLLYSRSREKPSAWFALSAGFMLGLAAITRPSALVLLPILIFDSLLKNRDVKETLRRRLMAPVLILLGCGLPILPVTCHNFFKGDDFVLIASQGGINFYIGNRTGADGTHAILPEWGTNWDVPAASYSAYQATGRTLKPSEVSAYYSRLAWQDIIKDPLNWLTFMLKKFTIFWNRSEISNNRDLYFFQNETSILPILRLFGFWLIAPLGLLGWWLGWSKRILPRWFLWFVVFYMLSVVFFFVTARFRAPLIPFLLICSGIVVSDLLEPRARWLHRERIKNLALLCLCGAFVNVNFWGIKPENPAHSWFSLGNAHLKAGQWTEAEVAFRQALQADSTYLQVHLNLGVVAYTQKDLQTAAQEYQQELQLNPRDARAWNNLGVIRFEEDKLDEAAALYERALELQPYYSDARFNAAQAFFQLGMEHAQRSQTKAATDYFEHACELDTSKAIYFYNYAL